MDEIRYISLDLETYSDVDLKKCGVYKYAESPNFEILLFAYSINGGEVIVIDLANGEKLPIEIIAALTDEMVTKWGFNVSFERICLSQWLRRNYPHYFSSYNTSDDTVGNYLDPSSWRCSMIWSAYLGLPFSLEGVGFVLSLQEQKMKEGKDLIRYFCVPCKPTKTNGGRTRNLPKHDMTKWSTFRSYNKRDVEVEMSIQNKLAKYPVPDFIWDEYHLDQKINDRGIAIDMNVVEHAISMHERSKNQLSKEMKKLTNLDNPNSIFQMKQWLTDNGLETDTLNKKAVAEMLKDAPEDLADVLTLHQLLAKTSIKKYQAMQNAVCSDNRARGMFFFYGGSRTGRWAGRIIQLQNLPQNHMPDLKQARGLVTNGDYKALELLYDDIPDTLSQLIRTAFIPRQGYKFVVADFSAIEARVLSFLAGEQWRMDVFANNGDIYCSAASAMFHVPVEKHGINGQLRQKGKIAELACIAEGQLILTNTGLVPIENITKEHLLWDGEGWVSHDGVIYKGEGEVITYEGLTATTDHLVWVEGESQPIQFGIAASSGAHLIQTGDGWKAIRLGESYQFGEAMEQSDESLLCFNTMYRVQKDSMAKLLQPHKWKITRLPVLFPTKTNTNMARQKIDSSQTTMREPKRSRISQLWFKRNSIQFFKCIRSWIIFDRLLWTATKGTGNRQNRQQQGLCKGQSSFCESFRKQQEQKRNHPNTIRAGILAICPERSCTKIVSWANEERNPSGCGNSGIREKKELANHQRKARLYDIRNAGRHHRFTVSGKLVHNCGYGGSVGALKSMGALDMGISEDELQPLVDAWRSSNPNIVQLWWDVDAAVKTSVMQKTTTVTHGIYFIYQSGMLFIKLPSGRKLTYVKPKIGTNRFGGEAVTYEGIGATKKWERIESYGAKFVENIVQAISRDILSYAMQTLSDRLICGHVHDELIIECPIDEPLDNICEQMGRTPPWINGLLLRADGYETMFYRKD